MWRFEHVALVPASKQVVWQWWTDVERWPQWDTDLIESAISGEVAVGTKGRMKVADDALISFTISEVVPEERFVIKVALFGAALSYTHSMVGEEDGTLKIVHGAEISGILGFVWRLLLKAKIQKTLTLALDEFARQVAVETARLAALNPQVVPAAPVEGAAPAAEAGSEETSPTEEQKATVPTGGDPVENELRSQDMRTQIEVAAQAPIVTPTAEQQIPVADAAVAEEPADASGAVKPEAAAGEHTAVVPVSPVITKKETKRPKKS